MSIAARCTCGRNGSGFGQNDGYCPRHTVTPRPTNAPPSVGEYLTGVEDRPLTTTPVVDQKPANIEHKGSAVQASREFGALYAAALFDKRKAHDTASYVPLTQEALASITAAAFEIGARWRAES